MVLLSFNIKFNMACNDDCNDGLFIAFLIFASSRASIMTEGDFNASTVSVPLLVRTMQDGDCKGSVNSVLDEKEIRTRIRK